MISEINLKVQTPSNAITLQKNKNYNVVSLSNYNKDTVSFTGKKNGSENSFQKTTNFLNALTTKFNSGCINVMERIKGKISHNVIVVSGPSGVGKDTIIDRLKTKNPKLKTMVSYTTRDPRPGEVDGVNYNYISQKKFDEMDKKGEFFQQLRMNGKCYGGTLADINSGRKSEDIIVNISSEEAYKIKNVYGKKSVLLFITAPSMEVIRQRLIKRGTETEEAIEKRLAYGNQQLEHIKDFDKVIINNNLDDAVEETFKYVESRHSKPVKIIDSLIKFLAKKIKK